MPPPPDPRAVLAQLVVRLRAATGVARAPVVTELLPLLSDGRIPLAVRLAAAARAIDAVPDRLKAVRPIVRATTAGLSPARTLQRLRHLQHLTEKGRALDALIAIRERKVKMACPRCGLRLTRGEMAKHLWHEHGLMLAKGKIRSQARAVDAVKREYSALGDPACFDRASAIGGEPAIRAWAAETASEEESLPLCTAAYEHNAGLCPACFGEVRPSVQPLPPPLAVAHGRLAGDGFVATAPSVSYPRIAATLAASVALVLLTLFFRFVLGAGFALIAYGVTFVLRAPRGSPDDHAINAAWRKLASKLADQRDSSHFLTRLCLTSVGRGDPFARANVLQQLIARSRANPVERQLLAVALTLQVDDSGRFGRDAIAGIADLAALSFRDEQPADFAEYVLATYLSISRDDGERARLRILLNSAAFAATLTPQDVIDLCSAAKHVREAMQLPAHHVALLYGVWQHRTSAPWATVGDAQTVFELCETSPATAASLLTNAPGLLLGCATHPIVEAELGPVLVTATGVSVSGAVASDPATSVSVENGGHELVFGKTRLRLERAIPEAFAEQLKAWLRFRAEVLASYPATYLNTEQPPSRLLARFVVRCPCGTECTPIVGAVARALRT